MEKRRAGNEWTNVRSLKSCVEENSCDDTNHLAQTKFAVVFRVPKRVFPM